MTRQNIEIREGPFLARELAAEDTENMTVCGRLRYEYFVKKRKWLPVIADPCLGETDQYDAHARHLAVFATGAENEAPCPAVVAYLRVVLGTASCGFMLDHEFRCLLNDDERASLPRAGAVELSRLVIDSDLCKPSSGNGSAINKVAAVELLLKLLYHVSLVEQIDHYLIVVERDWLYAFVRRFHLPFALIGSAHTFADGTTTVAAHTTRARLEQSIAEHSPRKFLWYRSA
jgi:N-acyl-L-homoserine lactone synthetase